MAKELRELSRGSYVSSGSINDIYIGSIQRIADAVELISSDYLKLKRDLEYYKKISAERLQTIEKLDKEIKSLKSVKTRYKNQLEALKAQKSFISSPEFETTA